MPRRSARCCRPAPDAARTGTRPLLSRQAPGPTGTRHGKPAQPSLRTPRLARRPMAHRSASAAKSCVGFIARKHRSIQFGPKRLARKGKQGSRNANKHPAVPASARTRTGGSEAVKAQLQPFPLVSVACFSLFWLPSEAGAARKLSNAESRLSAPPKISIFCTTTIRFLQTGPMHRVDSDCAKSGYFNRGRLPTMPVPRQ